MKEIIIRTDKRGRERAWKWSMPQIRWFPMPLDEARLMLATGQAVRTNRDGVQFRLVV